MAFTGQYDSAVIDLLVGYIEPGSVVLDLGASLGLYTIALARSSGRVVAVEPIPANCEILRRNLELNRIANVEIRQVALASQPATLTMHIEADGQGNAAVISGLPNADIIHHDQQGGLGSSIEVEAVRLDDMPLPGRCSLVKADLEGFELEALRGGERFIAEHRPVIFAEFSSEWMRSRGEPQDAPLQWAQDHRYTAQAVHLRRISRWRESNPELVEASPGDENLLLTPLP